MFDRSASVEYARKWAFSFNPHFYNFTSLGGDCTNFVSQCLFYGGIPMNYAQYGWFYVNLNQRAPAWTGVEEFWDFGVKNKAEGIRLTPCAREELSPADVIQLGDGRDFYHCLLVTRVGKTTRGTNVYVASHDYPAFDAPLEEYVYRKIRFGKVSGG